MSVRIRRSVLGTLCVAAATGLSHTSTASASMLVLGDIQVGNSGTVAGLAFDGQRNPIIMQKGDPNLYRVDRTTGELLETYRMSAPAGAQGLAWDRSKECFFTVQPGRTADALFSLCLSDTPGGVGTVTQVSRSIGPAFVAEDLETGNDGSIWFINNEQGGEILRVNKLTGLGVVQKEFDGRLGTLTAMALGPDGNLHIATDWGASHHTRIYMFDPDTGKTKLEMDLGAASGRIVDFDYDQVSQRWWGIVDPNSRAGNSFSLVKFDGLPLPNPTRSYGGTPAPVTPEPGSISMIAAGVGLLTLRRRMRRPARV